MLEFERIDNLPHGALPQHWLGDCRVVVVHPNSYHGTFSGKLYSHGKRVLIEVEPVPHEEREPGVYVQIFAGTVFKPGLFEVDSLIRQCHLKNRRQEDPSKWRDRANFLRFLRDRGDRMRAGVYEIKVDESSKMETVQLNADEVALCNAFMESRFAKVLRTEAADIDKLTRAVNKLYGLLNFKAPSVVLLPSPQAVVQAAKEHSPLEHGVLNDVMHEVCFGQDFRRARRFHSSDGLQRAWLHAENSIRFLFVDSTCISNGLNANDVFDAMLDLPGDERVQMWLDVHDECLTIWMHEKFCLAADFPAQVHVDSACRLHNENGPAVVWRDGSKMYMLCGHRVPERVIEAPETLTAEDITNEGNVEVRRLMMERFGVQRYLIACGAKVKHEDETGVLYTLQMPRDEELAMVRVRNSTPEPDGTFKYYYLRVPPETATAREGVAWTFGLHRHEYHPKVET